MEILAHAAHQEILDGNITGAKDKTFGSSFFRGEHCNFNPYGRDQCSDQFASNFILKGWLPDSPFISHDTKITAFGSCFAEHISHHLAKMGFKTTKERDSSIYVSSMGEGLVNVHSILQQFRWALDNWQPPTNLWHGYNAEEYDINEEIRIKTRSIFLDTDVFILTFGLSEIWYDEITQGVFWRAVPMQHYDEKRHKFRICTFTETKQCLRETLRLIKHYIPKAKIVLTVSPIPLITTFRPVSCISANSVSKALIRAALDEVLREYKQDQQDIYYFPAFEIINECFPNRFVEDGRHLQTMVVPAIMQLFEATFCNTQLNINDAEINLKKARLANATTLLSHPLFSQAF